MLITVKDGVLYCGERPIPAEDSVLEDLPRERLVISSIDRVRQQIFVYTSSPLTGKMIVFIGDSIYCESENRWIDYSFTHRFEAKIGEDIIPVPNSKTRCAYIWINPQSTFLKDYRVGSFLTFCEVNQ